MSAPAAVASAPACPRCAIHAESIFRVDGLCCGEEAAILQRRLTPLAGVEDITADIVGQRLRVTYDAAVLSTNTIVEAVAETGMRAWLEHEKPIVRASSRLRGWLVLASAIAVGGGMLLQALQVRPEGWSIALFVTAAIAGGIFPARRAWASVRLRELDINTLMIIAVVGAGILGEWAEAGTVVLLFAVAQWLESRSMDRAREAIRSLMDLSPPEARIMHGDHEEMMAVDRVAIGTTIIVRPGEKIPLDGVVQAGRSDVNQAPITGESLPIDKAPGDDVFAGTINGHGALDVVVTRHRRDTTLARIIHLVETAQARRAPSQQFIDRFARWYTPAVIALAVVIAVVPPLFGAAAETWFYRALVLLVVSCPCALVISTPVSIVSALAGGARRGVLFKGGVHLERLAGIKAIAFDKTGTLTRAQLQVTALHPANGVTELELLATAAAIETRSEHPIAAAIVRAARDRRLPVGAADEVTAVPGLGAEGRLDGARVVCGNARMFEARGLLSSAGQALADAAGADGASPVLVARDGVVMGAIAVADQTREVAADTIDLLHRQGIRPIVMLTGDHRAAAEAVARRLGIDEVHAGLLPEEKVAAIEEVRRRYGSVAMVGDGVNDAPALARADVGIAMGAIGSDAALEVADVALMTDELPKIAYAIRLSRAAVRNIRVNIAVSIVLKAAFLALAVSGTATLWMAVFADTGASLIVVANAMRLLRQA
jgi:Cd2+/Zn2+-exporting ATPase